MKLFFPELSYKIVGCAYSVYNHLGSGLTEKVYQNALALSFRENHLQASQQVPFTIKFNDKTIGRYYLDFIVEEKIIVEIKKNLRFSKSNIDQVVNYFHVSNLQLALLINFGYKGVHFKRIISIPGYKKSAGRNLNINVLA